MYQARKSLQLFVPAIRCDGARRLSELSAARPAVYKAHNGEKVVPTFSGAEMKRRQLKFLDIMHEKNMDAMILTSMHNVAYISDFLYCSFGRNYAAVLTKDGQLTTVSAGIDGGQPWRRTSKGDNVVYTDWEKTNYLSALSEVIPSSSHCRVGCELDHLSAKAYKTLSDHFSAAEFEDISDETMGVRMVKSDEEIDLIKAGAAVADIGGAAVVEILEAGGESLREVDVAQHATNAMVNEIARRYPHSEIRDTWTWFQSGINTDGAHNPVTCKVIEDGDILSLNCFPMISGYYTALERTLFYKHIPSDAALKVWEANVAVHEKGLSLIRPGNKCGDIARELNELYVELGEKIGIDLLACRSFGYGHSFGLLSHYYGREAALELREDNSTVLAPGHVVSMEPMVMMPHSSEAAGGYREHDILVIHEDGGVENITHFPYGPDALVIQ